LISRGIETAILWRGEMLARVRTLIKQVDPEVVEEWKWRGVPVWSHAGIICTGETYKNVVKMTFAKGASLEDPSGLFNSICPCGLLVDQPPMYRPAAQLVAAGELELAQHRGNVRLDGLR
jgi:hypothetical protein